jgi:hypothetical protein
MWWSSDGRELPKSVQHTGHKIIDELELLNNDEHAYGLLARLLLLFHGHFFTNGDRYHAALGLAALYTKCAEELDAEDIDD